MGAQTTRDPAAGARQPRGPEPSRGGSVVGPVYALEHAAGAPGNAVVTIDAGVLDILVGGARVAQRLTTWGPLLAAAIDAGACVLREQWGMD